MGYTKDVFVFINKRLLYSGKNSVGECYTKNPGGRSSHQFNAGSLFKYLSCPKKNLQFLVCDRYKRIIISL